MRYIIATLGCKVNQYESEAIDQLLRAHGHENVESGAGADAIVVNTCAVTAEGVRKVRQLCRRLERENPGAAVRSTAATKPCRSPVPKSTSAPSSAAAALSTWVQQPHRHRAAPGFSRSSRRQS